MTWKDIPWQPTSGTLRQFAVCWMAFVGLVAWRVAHNEHFVMGVVLALLAGGVGLTGLLWPAAVRPLFLALTVATFPVGWVVSRVALAVLFYGVFTPIGVVMRCCGRDGLALRPCAGRSSYWETKATPENSRRYFQSF